MLVELFFSLEGRIGRAQWWLAQSLIAGGLLVVLVALWLAQPVLDPLAFARSPAVNAAMTAAMLAGMAPTVKRYHDLGRSGWWFLLAFVPLLNFWQLYECGFRAGQPQANRFGPPPREPALARA